MRTVLVATIGGSPQVVTETLWCLMNGQVPEGAPASAPPCRIHMITTAFLKKRDPGVEATIRERIRTVYREHGHRPPQDEDVVFDIVTGPDGSGIGDIQTLEDNNAFSKHITQVVRDYAEDDTQQIHMSIAGGRKTMSSLAQSAMTFFGRVHDVLTHVLVIPSSLENHPEFWWPGQPRWEGQEHGYLVREVRNRSGELVDTVRLPTGTESVTATLVSVPFVPVNSRLRHTVLLTEEERRAGTYVDAFDPDELDRRRRSYLAADDLVLDFRTRELRIGSEPPIVLEERYFAIYALLAIAKKQGWKGAGPEGIGDNHGGWIARTEYLDPRGRPARKLEEIYHGILVMESKKQDSGRSFVHQLRGRTSNRPDDPLASPFNKLQKEVENNVRNGYLLLVLLPQKRREGHDRIRIGLPIEAERIRFENVGDVLWRADSGLDSDR